MPQGCKCCKECIQTSFFPNATTTTTIFSHQQKSNGRISFPPFLFSGLVLFPYLLHKALSLISPRPLRVATETCRWKTRGVSRIGGRSGGKKKPKTIGVGTHTSTPTLLVLLLPATEQKTKKRRLLSKCFRLSLGESMYSIIGYGGHFKVHVDMAD